MPLRALPDLMGWRSPGHALQRTMTSKFSPYKMRIWAMMLKNFSINRLGEG
jgi:hypothetical protein